MDTVRELLGFGEPKIETIIFASRRPRDAPVGLGTRSLV